MTQWAVTIGRNVSNPAPAWLATLNANPNTVYEIGETPSSVLPGRVVWPPAGSTNPLMTGGGDNNALYLTSGYGGSVFVPDLGKFGTMIFGSTGEHTVTNQLTAFGLSEDTPSWNMFQQPQYATSLAEADAMNADAYFNVADYNACVSASRYITYAGTDAVNWDRSTFPVGFGDGWVLRRKFGANSGSTLTGGTRPHWFRYGMPCYVPPSMTGTGNGAILVNSQGTIYGPFNQGHTPPGESDGPYFAELWGDGTRKHWLYAMDVKTKVWTRLPNPVPQAAISYFVANPHSAVDVEAKRVYYTCVTGGATGLYYVDLSGGLASATLSMVSVTDSTAGAAPSYGSILVVPRFGPNAGRKLLYVQDFDNAALLMWDLSASPVTLRRLSITGFPGNYSRFGFDPASNHVYVTNVGAGPIQCRRFALPTDPTSAANYTLASLTINMNGKSVEAGSALADGGQRSHVIPELGVILVPMKNNQCLAFKPQ